MAEYSGEYGHPYPRVDQYGNPVPPVDQYGNPVPRETPGSGYAVAPDYGTASSGGLAAVAYPHEGDVGGVVSPDGAAYTQEFPVTGGVAYPHDGAAYTEEFPVTGGVAYPHDGAAYTQEIPVTGGMVYYDSGIGAAGGQIEPAREEHTTLGETLRRSGSSSSSSSSEEGGGGERRKKKSIKEKIKEKLPGKAKQHGEGETGTHAAAPHEKKGIMEKIKDKLPGGHGHHHSSPRLR